MNGPETALDAYVASLAECGAVRSEPVRRAFGAVRRHRFLDGWYEIEAVEDQLRCRPVRFDRDHPDPEQLHAVYSDQALVTVVDDSMPTSSTSQPSLVAEMLELLDLQPGMRVLEIGTGTGYNAALMAEIVGPRGRVTSVELQGDVADRARRRLRVEGYRNVLVTARDGYHGVPEDAPFDRIVATVGCSDLSPRWIDQLAPGGTLLVPLQHGYVDPLVSATRDPRGGPSALGRIVGWSAFMPIQGAMDWTNPWRCSILPGLSDAPRWERPLPEPLRADAAESGMNRETQRSFQYYLALTSHNLWFSQRGYGLADCHVGAAVTATSSAIEGRSLHDDEDGLESLYHQLLASIERWDRLGRPAPDAYALRFLPKPAAPPADEDAIWTIERPFTWQLVQVRPP